jgi:hypothetical protein
MDKLTRCLGARWWVQLLPPVVVKRIALGIMKPYLDQRYISVIAEMPISPCAPAHGDCQRM